MRLSTLSTMITGGTMVGAGGLRAVGQVVYTEGDVIGVRFRHNAEPEREADPSEWIQIRPVNGLGRNKQWLKIGE